VRRAKSPGGRPFTLTDTVGFVRHLPHQLVDAFRSTLEEAADAELILHVVDGSDADPAAQLSAVRAVLNEIGAGNVPELVVINKIDDADPVALKALQLRERDSVLVSARTGEGVPELRLAIEERLPERDQLIRASVPYSRGDLVARAHAAGEVAREEHGPDGTLLEARVPPELAFELERYAVV
jgi:GTP-binding protein HflX